MQFERYFDLDLRKSLAASVDLGPVLFTGDSDSLKLGLRLSDGGEAYEVAGTVSGKAVLADGSTVAPLEASAAGSLAWIVVPQDALAVPGKVDLFLRITDSGAGSAVALHATATVIRSETDTVYVPGDPLPDVDELRAIADDCEAATAAAQAYKSLVDNSAHTSLLTLGKANRMNNSFSDSLRGITATVSNGTVTLTGTATNVVRLKITNTAAINSSVQSAWRAESLGLTEGHRYGLLVHTMSGSYSSGKLQIGMYGPDSLSTCWVDVPAAGEVVQSLTTGGIPGFVYDSSTMNPGCIVVYIQSGCAIATGGITLGVELVDLTAYAQARDTFLNGYGAYRDKVAQTLGRIDLTDGVDAATELSGISIKRTGNIVTLNGTATTGLRIKLSGGLAVNAAVQSAWRAETPALVEGRTYKIAATVLRGTRTSGTVSVTFYDSTSGYSIEAVLFSASGAYAPAAVNEPRYSKKARFDGDNMRALCVYISNGAVLSNLTLMVDVLDVETEEDELPGYYYEDGYIDERVQTIRELRAGAGINSASFLWFTDPHYYHLSAINKLMTLENGFQTVNIAQYLRRQLNNRLILCGGDMIRGNSMTDDICRVWLSKAREYLDPIYADTFTVLGNHEYNINDPLTSPELYALFCKHQALHMDSVSPVGDYTFADRSTDTRYYMLGCTKAYKIFSDTVTWLAAQLQTVTESHIIIISHIGLTDQAAPAIHEDFEDITDLIDAYNGRTGNYTAATGEIVCALTGHVHWDGAAVTTGGTPIIATTCDRAFISDDGDAGVREVRKPGTIGEQAMDYVLIDYTARTIDMIRIGGSILGASYDSNTGKIYDTDVGTGTEYTGSEWVIASTHKDRHFTY